MENQQLPILTQTLISSQKDDLPLLERQLNLPDVMRSADPSVLALSKQDFPKLLKFAALTVKNYLDYAFPQSHISVQFAVDLIDQRPDWKLQDFILCFKFIRTRQDLPQLKVFGNLTPAKLNEMVACYERERCYEREKMHAEKAGNHRQEARSLNNISSKILEKFSSKNELSKGDAVLGKEYEQTAARQEQKRQSPFYRERTPPAPDERFFKKSA